MFFYNTNISIVSKDLETATLEELVPGDPIDGFDLIVAADVLVYFGDIEKLVSRLELAFH